MKDFLQVFFVEINLQQIVVFLPSTYKLLTVSTFPALPCPALTQNFPPTWREKLQSETTETNKSLFSGEIINNL